LKGTGDFSFLVVNDLHFFDEECWPWFESVVRQMRATAPEAEFCLLCGDLADNGQPAQHDGVRDAFAKLGSPAYAAVGNHDYLTADDRRSYEERFKDQINYIFEHEGWQLVGIDTTEGNAWQDTKISSQTLAWLDENLPKLDHRKPGGGCSDASAECR
jgi:predicted MPP superfamily phosphohydrolase